jgi:transposase
MDFLTQFLGSTARARVARALATSEWIAMTRGQIAKRAGVSAQVAAREIRAFRAMGLLKKARVPASERTGKAREEYWVLDSSSSAARSFVAFVREVSPAQYTEIERALKKTGRVTTIVLSGIFVGDPTRPADLVVAGDSLNEGRLERVVKLFEPKFGHEIRYAAFSVTELRYRLTIQDRLLRDILDFPHRTLLNKGGII